ncbi:polyketide cyclase/dehydrase/lipid transport protein [Rhodococcus sp. OK519]|uniref:SRPBCC family protein n=1 Tax=Rhodococcus sp. OK519 TaxID=2135729 RepID=UPI000D34502E|nr:polyketide cyclase/dehydrase/lipid transport protein [Rhodococcus sp. OK519]
MAKTLRTEETIVINRPVAEVFEYLTNPENGTEWASNIVEYKTVSGSRDEVGAVFALTARVAGAHIHATEAIVDYEANKRIGLESRESKIGYTRELDFDSDGDGATKVTFRQDGEEGSGLFKFADAIAQKLYARDVRGNLENAKEILESSS